MNKLLAWFNPTQWIVLGAVVLAVSGGAALVVHKIKESGRQETVALYERKIAAAVDEAVRQAQKLQDKVDEANTQYTAAMERVQATDDRIRAINDGMRKSAPSARALAGTPAAALSQYAAEVDRDFDECRSRYAEVGQQAAGASEAAWAHRDSWPRAVERFNQLKKGISK